MKSLCSFAALPLGILLACAPAEDAGRPAPATEATTSDGGASPDVSPPDMRSGDAPPAVDLVFVPDRNAAPVCAVGETQACMCPSEAMGTRACVSEEGRYSTCGCPSPNGPDILVPPAPPRVSTCGTTTCAPFTQPDTEVSARACCTADGRCGASSGFVFGRACVPRGGPKGVPDDACPNESPNFLDLYGCCRPDGACGLSVDHVPNFDLGCVERTEMAALLNAGSGQRDFLSLIFLLPIKKAEFGRIACKAR